MKNKLKINLENKNKDIDIANMGLDVENILVEELSRQINSQIIKNILIRGERIDIFKKILNL